MEILRKLFYSKKSFIIWSVLIFLFALGLRCLWINQKVGIHVDEGLTHYISTYTGYNWSKVYDKNIVYTGKEVKDITFKNDKNLSETFSHLKELRKYNDGDTAHTSLYYSLYRLWMTGGEKLSLNSLINRGCGLNLVFFSVSFFFMYKLLRELFKDRRLIPLGLAAAYLNTGSISNTLFIRPYQLQEMLIVIMTYVFVIYYKKIECWENIITVKDFIILSIVLGFTMLSAYFSLLYIALLGIVLIYLSFRNMQYKNIGFLFGTLSFGLILAIIIYIGYPNGFISDRAGEIFRSTEMVNVLYYFFISFLNLLFIYANFLFYIPIVILMLIVDKSRFRKENYTTNDLTKIILITGFIWSMIVIYLAPYKILRYIMPIFPMLALALPYMTSQLKNKAVRIIVPLFIIILAVYAVLPTSIESYESGSKKVVKNKIPFGAKIENLYIYHKADLKFLLKPDVPVIFLNNFHNWRYSNIVPYLNDNQKYEFYQFEDETPSIYHRYRHFYVLYGVKITDKSHPAPNGFEILDKFYVGHFLGYELIQK